MTSQRRTVTVSAGCSRQLVLPGRVGVDPMDRLIVANFKADPEFVGIEPQVFNDSVNGTGMRVLRYRKDRMVDVYWQSGVRIDPNTFTAGAGVGDFAETVIDPARLEITPRGVDLHVAFTDAQNRTMEFRVVERMPPTNGFPLLAPVGEDIVNPLQLFLAYMPEIRFVRPHGNRGRRPRRRSCARPSVTADPVGRAAGVVHPIRLSAHHRHAQSARQFAQW